MPSPSDEAIRALVRSVAMATVEYVAELLAEEEMDPADLWPSRGRITALVVEATFGSAEDDSTHPLHAVRGSR